MVFSQYPVGCCSTPIWMSASIFCSCLLMQFVHVCHLLSLLLRIIIAMQFYIVLTCKNSCYHLLTLMSIQTHKTFVHLPNINKSAFQDTWEISVLHWKSIPPKHHKVNLYELSSLTQIFKIKTKTILHKKNNTVLIQKYWWLFVLMSCDIIFFY